MWRGDVLAILLNVLLKGRLLVRAPGLELGEANLLVVLLLFDLVGDYFLV